MEDMSSRTTMDGVKERWRRRFAKIEDAQAQAQLLTRALVPWMRVGGWL
jgi:hypothetical protein